MSKFLVPFSVGVAVGIYATKNWPQIKEKAVPASKALIDDLGGLYLAVEIAKKEAGIDAAVDPERRIYPGPRGFGQQIRDLVSGDLGGWLAAELLPGRVSELAATLRALLADGNLAYLPPFWLDFGY